MHIAETLKEARTQRAAVTGSVALVPTMGALHDGHLALIQQAHENADHVFVSIFVNPTQFGPGEDLQRYPRPLQADLEQCRAANVAAVFMPGNEEIYPPRTPDTAVDVPSLSAMLEGQHRPSHFPGVCRVVAKLLNILQPDVACFGLKDYQQLKIVQAMVADLMMPVRILACPTVREADGLALSSRNRYLSPDDRQHAAGLYKALCQARMLVEDTGESDPLIVEQAMQQVLKAHHLNIDYATVRHPQTLDTLDCLEPALTHGVVALLAARIGKVRLIDNMILGQP